ncbi:hypothetical protein FDF74_03005 [Clostridium niameyense]|uniref:Glycosyltransferase family 39 protein n=1 Tax=Clostridium niameyense TaxID=1622073 RepID=A0A6M0R9C4_9CLOT|nr:glycosyltransferase family 39 protein [Clostridium niameyense]NEZ46179.1 hypothetical protein [Clostridium niameyense]
MNLRYANFKNKIYFGIITFLGVLVRIFFILKVPCYPISDFQKYQQIATNIFMGEGHYYLGKPIAFQPMGYPFVLGYFYKFIGSNEIVLGKVLNVLFSTITLIIILKILFKIYNNLIIIYITYVVITFLPNYIVYNNVLGSEVLTTLLLASIIYLQLCNFNNKCRYVIIGILIGLATLTKPFFILYPVIISIVEWLKNKDIKQQLKLFFISTTVMCMVIAPWTYRNYKKFNLLIPISYNGGYVLFINNNNNNNNGAWMPISNIDISDKLKKQFKIYNFNYRTIVENEVDQVMLKPELNNLFKEEAKKWIINNPIKFIKIGVIRVKNTFFNGAADIYQWGMNNEGEKDNLFILKSNPMRYFSDYYIYILSFFGFLYIIYNFKNIVTSFFKKNSNISYMQSILFFNILYFIFISFVFEGQQRYNFPILFLCVISIFVRDGNLVKSNNKLKI